MSWARAALVPGPHGICAIVGLPEDPHEAAAALQAEERALTAGMAPARLSAFAAGRLALRAAARQLGVELGSILRGTGGEPIMPPGLVGSVSHDRFRAVALVGPTHTGSVGVDIETTLADPAAVARQVLTAGEWDRLRQRPVMEWAVEVLVTFSIKEATQKALAATLGSIPDARRIEVDLHDDGSARVELRMRGREVGPSVEALWWSDTGEVLATARASPR